MWKRSVTQLVCIVTYIDLNQIFYYVVSRSCNNKKNVVGLYCLFYFWTPETGITEE